MKKYFLFLFVVGFSLLTFHIFPMEETNQARDCKVCLQHFKNRDEFSQHFRSISCTACDPITTHPCSNAFILHYQARHAGNTGNNLPKFVVTTKQCFSCKNKPITPKTHFNFYLCSECPQKEYYCLPSFNNHNKSAHNKKALLQCFICNKKFSATSLARLGEHKSKDHKGYTIKSHISHNPSPPPPRQPSPDLPLQPSPDSPPLQSPSDSDFQLSEEFGFYLYNNKQRQNSITASPPDFERYATEIKKQPGIQFPKTYPIANITLSPLKALQEDTFMDES